MTTVVAIGVTELAWTIAAVGANVRGTWMHRRGILIEARSATGTRGMGEATPLAVDQLDGIREELHRLAATCPFEVTDDHAGVRRVSACATIPAARFAIETAIATVLACERGISLGAWLNASAVRTLTSAVVVDDATEAAAAWAAGARTLKIKVGRADDVARVAAIGARVPDARLRLDANRAWPPHEVERRLAELAVAARGAIEYCEEPCTDVERLRGLALPCRIALDESIGELRARGRLDAWLASKEVDVAAIVLKPTELGGLIEMMEIAQAARAGGAGVLPIVSHALEGPVAMAACMELARAIGGDAPVGLAPHAGLAAAAAAAAAAAETETVEVIVAYPDAATLDAISAALTDGRPIGLIHHRASPEQQAEQRAMLAMPVPRGTAAVLFTSGSTAEPRGIVLARTALAAAAEASAIHLGWRDDDRWLLALSTAHAGGLSIVVRCLAARRPISLLAGDFDPARAAAQIVADRVTLASLVPTQLAALLDDPTWRPPSHLRAVLLGGAAASAGLLAAAAARGVPFLTTYGLTESFGQIATQPLATAGRVDPTGAAGLPLAGVTITAGTAAAPAPIRVRAPQLATQTLAGTPIAPELVTADLGYVDAHGALHVVGRADDVIITGGENVHPATVEAILTATPGVRAACAFGVVDARWGQLVGAALAVDAGFDLATARTAWHAALPGHARPRRLALCATLPLLATGKIDRRTAAALPTAPIVYR